MSRSVLTKEDVKELAFQIREYTDSVKNEIMWKSMIEIKIEGIINKRINNKQGEVEQLKENGMLK